MPRIVCRTCGREVYATAPIEQLFADERRCPRCGAPLSADRRKTDRRVSNRRASSPAESVLEVREAPEVPERPERRTSDRRKDKRRDADAGPGRKSGDWLE